MSRHAAGGHPDEDLLLNLLGSVPSAEAAVLLHLLGCRRCASRALVELRPTPAEPAGFHPPAPSLGIEYDDVLDRRERATAKTAADIARRRTAARKRIAKLRPAPLESHPELVRQSAREDAWATAAVLLDHSRAALPA